MMTIKIPINVKIRLPRRLPQQLLEPILKPLWRGPKTAGTELHDRIALHKSLLLCPSCVAKMGRRHLQRLGYSELRQFHGYGICDGEDQQEQSCAMWMWDGSKNIQGQEQESQWNKVRERDRLIRERSRR